MAQVHQENYMKQAVVKVCSLPMHQPWKQVYVVRHTVKTSKEERKATQKFNELLFRIQTIPMVIEYYSPMIHR